MNFTIEILQALRQAIQHYPLLSIAFALCLGVFAGIATYGTVSARRERRLRRMISIFQHSHVQSLEIHSWSKKIVLQQLHPHKAIPQVSVQGPASQAIARFPGATVQDGDTKLIYYFPEVFAADLPMGILAEKYIQLIFGKPSKYCVRLKLEPVIIQSTGRWYPAINHRASGLTVLRHQLAKRIRKVFWLRGYRNLYVCDYIAEGEALGVIQVDGEKEPTIVHATKSGFIITFEAQQYTDVVPGANVLFLGVPEHIPPIYFDGDRPGHFGLPDNQAPPVGRVVTEGSLLCTVTSLHISQEVYMPVTGLIVRQYKNVGDVVLYRDSDLNKDKLFDYIPLEQPLT